MNKKRGFWLYLLECDNGTFYTGFTKNIAVRYYQHKNGRQSAKYTRSFKPVKIAQCWRLEDTVGTALKVERFIKRQRPATKARWIEAPEELKQAIETKMNLQLDLFPFDAQRVEEESAKLDVKKVRNGFDPFAAIPPPE